MLSIWTVESTQAPDGLSTCQFPGKHAGDDRWHHARHISAETRELLDCTGPQDEVIRLGGHEQSLHFRVEPPVHHGKLKLIREIGKRTHAANHYARPYLPGKVNNQAVPGMDRRIPVLGCQLGHHDDPFFGAECVALGRIRGNYHVNMVEDGGRSCQNVDVPIRRRVKRTRKQRSSHGALTIPRGDHCGKPRLRGACLATIRRSPLLILALALAVIPADAQTEGRQNTDPGEARPEPPAPESAAALPAEPVPEWIRLREPGSEITGTEAVILDSLYRAPGSRTEYLASVEALVRQSAVTRADSDIVARLAGIALADPASSSPTDRARAVSLMGSIGGAGAGSALLQSVLRDPDDFVRSQAVDALIRSGLRADERVSLTLARTLQLSAVSGLDQRTAGVALSAIEAIYSDAEEVPREVFDALIETASRGQRSALRERAFAIARSLGGLD